MLLKYSDQKFNKRTKIYLICDSCNVEFIKPSYTDYINKEKPKHPNEDLCNKCWRKFLNNRVEYKEKMSKSLKETHEKNPNIRKKISKTMKDNQINVGEKNGMKNIEARLKVSKYRKELFKDQKERNKISLQKKKEWKEGKFNNAKLGKCKWFNYIDQNNKNHKVQGTYELAFIKWLDKNNLIFETHKGRITYKNKNNKICSYYPDFYVYNWESYVEIKSNYTLFLSSEKMKNIIDSNKHLKFIILSNNELKNLGIKI